MGEWTVTKEAEPGVAGEQQRVCEHDATHVETQAIAALPLPSATPDDTGSNNAPGNGGQQGTNPGGNQVAGGNTNQGTQGGGTGGQGGYGYQPEVTVLDDDTPLAEGIDEMTEDELAGLEDENQFIADDENPLAASESQESNDWLPWLIIPGVVLIAGIAIALARHRKSSELNG